MMQSQQVNNKRRERDVMKLITSGKYDVQLVNEESTQEFDVLFDGPIDSHYEGVSSTDNNIPILSPSLRGR